MKKLCVGFTSLMFLAALLARPGQAAQAQTGPESTPENGYPPPATPEPTSVTDEGYPVQSIAPTTAPIDSGYVAPTTAVPPADAAPQAVIGSEAPAPTVVPTLPLSQSTMVRNRAILWAGFLITLLIFGIAVYGAMLMYTRRRS
ncbi:MAG: hypothetical protein IPM53_09190 [Anaerolineaceae bacterium]|nr:hypothetical protein [Anaerolineaceae bacterium]